MQWENTRARELYESALALERQQDTLNKLALELGGLGQAARLKALAQIAREDGGDPASEGVLLRQAAAAILKTDPDHLDDEVFRSLGRLLARTGRLTEAEALDRQILSSLERRGMAGTRRDRRPAGDPANWRLVAFGDPEYPKASGTTAEAFADGEIRSALRRGLNLEPLPATRDEIREIAALFPTAEVYLGSEATEERVKQVSSHADLLHLAGHGLVDERFPLDSALALSLPGQLQKGQDNGLLQAWEVFESVHLDAQLVTLSACDTALGREMGGEGLLGLTRAFQFAGARSVLASLWSVSDTSTAMLMKAFYTYLRQGKTKDEALREAQLDLIRSKDGELSHPYHWAGFSLYGDWK